MHNEMQLQEGWEHLWDLKKKKQMHEKSRKRKKRGGERREGRRGL